MTLERMTEKLTEEAVKSQPFAYAWRWKGGTTWKLTFTKKPNAHLGIEIKELFEQKVSPAAELRAAAASALASLDNVMSGTPPSTADMTMFDILTVAAPFGSAAFQAGYDEGQATHAMLRAFLLALVDPMHSDLDYLRAKPSAGPTARAALTDRQLRDQIVGDA